MQHLAASPAHRNCWISIIITKYFVVCQVSPSYDSAEHCNKPGRLLGSGPACGIVAGKWQSWSRTSVFVVQGKERWY